MSPRSAAPSGPFPYRHPIEIRFRDTDALGHVNNAVYLTYFEAARAGYYRAVTGSAFGTDGDEASPRTFLIAEARITYRSPALFGESLHVDCRVGWAGRSSFSLDYLVSADASALGEPRAVAYGQSVQVMFDLHANRVTRLPADLLALMERFEGGPIPSRPGG
ncbi:MAG: acyl-CoA thioesterase [Chloroflexi bacterium]|nr:acyl-CoA thioesterase [Chloroflexota bacterium]